jgi:acetone carboxylase alpha subunit
MNAVLNNNDQGSVLDQFLKDNQLFLAPDPEIMSSHAIGPRDAREEAAISAGQDPHKMNHLRGVLHAALDESFTMVEQMGTAPGAKWGDLVTGIYTATGDLSFIGPKGIIAFASVCHYPIKFIRKYWTDDPTVGVRDGDGFIHNDARYGGIHNTDQSLIMPVFYKGELVCWVSSTVHEGENGACEPGGMPAAAESKFDEGLKMPPFKIVENNEVRRDLLTFLQNSVRDPKLQHEDTKVKLHAVIRLKERVLHAIETQGLDLFVATLRQNLEDVEAEVRRRITELPDGTSRIAVFPDSTLREQALMKVNIAVTVKGDRMVIDLRGSSPQFTNRAINTTAASFKSALISAFLLNVWPDLPHSMAAFSPIEVVTDPNSLVDASFETPQAMSLISLFKAAAVAVPLNKLRYSLPRRYTAVVALQYDQPATFIYGGLTQHMEVVGNFCADINGKGQGGRSFRDGEPALSPIFSYMCDTGEQELMEEELPIVRLGAHRFTKDRMGFGKFRGGPGYEQIVSVKGSMMWGFMVGCTGGRFSCVSGLFGGYGAPAYVLAKIKGANVFELMKNQPELVDFDMIKLLNEQKIPGATYSTSEPAMTFELAQEGDLYMICQGTGGGYGDVLERDPELIMQDLADDLISDETARDLYKVVYNPANRVVDTAATQAARAAERKARLTRSEPFDSFVARWVTDEPPASLPYYGTWKDPNVAFAGAGPTRQKMDARAMQGLFMPNPKDMRIAQLEAQVKALQNQA